MTARTYTYTCDGFAADGQTWFVEGEVKCEYPEAFTLANKDCFQRLTNGKARYGEPGLGCNGPYQVRCIILRARKD